ncbi:MFS transporter [Amorphoplanes digitatis]|uniref:MFS family permease n=1 Tax=Actinoplanes digitatis TaxID=1868 RepID=A0A7W7MRB1_9ACTN|nr:MFS transporter [Actinoplanes digitatis]MBB4764061.1 MFS family permease [Actinoplanes digitatis]GID93881.1 MFS transporter [Actinoplanes digitatis]
MTEVPVLGGGPAAQAAAGPPPGRPNLTAPRAPAVLAGLCLATSAYSVLQSLVVPALGVFRRELGTTPSGAAWILTAFLLSASVSTPLLGRLADLHGKRRVMLGALTAMSVGSTMSALADGLGPMVAGRAVQGLGGAVFPLCFALIRDHLPQQRRPRAFVAVSTVMSVGGAAGTVAAGPLLSVASSRWLFGIPALLSALAAIPVAALLPRGTRRDDGGRVDWPGAVLLATWLGLLLLAISLSGTYGWTSPRVLVPGLAVPAVAALWVVVQRRTRHPLVDLRTLALPTVRATNAATLLLGVGMFGSWMLVPLLVAQPASSGIGFGASPTVVGLVMLPTALGTLLVMPVQSLLVRRHGPRAALAAGTATAGTAYLMLAVLHGTLAQVCVAVLVMGAGVGLAFAAVGALVVEAVPREQTGVSAAINTVMRTVGGSLGATLGGTVLTWSAGSGGVPSPRSYSIAMVVFAASLFAALLCTLRIPRPVHVP